MYRLYNALSKLHTTNTINVVWGWQLFYSVAFET